jgi:hypothetical protein
MGELGVCGVVGQGGVLSGLSNPPEPEPVPEPEPKPGADARGSYMRSSLKRPLKDRTRDKMQQINVIISFLLLNTQLDQFL